ncbi:MAG: molybdopterin-dependent oxidoreductase [Thermoanaerobaculia bacterium]
MTEDTKEPEPEEADGTEEPTPPEPAQSEAARRAAEEAEVERRLRRMSRRGFVTAAIAVGTGYAGWKWLMHQPRDGGVQEPLRRVLEANEKIAEAYFDPKRLAPELPLERAAARPRINGHLGLDRNADHSNWRLRIEGMPRGDTADLTLDEIRRFPRHEMVTEFKCIEGWSMVVHWTGARLSEVMAKFPPASRSGRRPDLQNRNDLARYVAMETPGRGYYVGLDMASALHPQTLLVYEINRQPLSWEHGAPLRLAIPVKYGIKNIKRIATIRYTDIRPPDFWAERGYDWYAGH